MRPIICLSSEPWSRLPGRTQQYMSRLRDCQILYFSPSRRWQDFSPGQKGLAVRPNVTAYTLPPALLPLEEKHGPLFRRRYRQQGAFVARQADRNRLRDPLLWVTSPEHVHLLDHLRYDGLVYDCDREWDELPPHWEGRLAQAADVVLAASPLLVNRLSPCSANIVLAPNGVNLPLFDPDSRRPDPLPQVRGALIGWAGTIWSDLDLYPLLYAARERPDWTFLLLGRREKGNPLLSRLKKLPNVIVPGPCPVSEVPGWLYRCDVLVELLREERPYDDVISPRVYEYLATGKPIVSMLWPGQVEQFPDVIYNARDEEEFLTLCAHALEEDPGFVAGRRRDHAAQAAWPLRAAQISRILTTAGLL